VSTLVQDWGIRKNLDFVSWERPLYLEAALAGLSITHLAYSP
jgi:hypothetical protein